MKQIFISSVQKEFERERAAIKKMIETDPIIKPHFKAFVFEIDAPAADKSTRQVYLEELEKCDIYLVLVGDKYGYCKGDEPSPTEQEFDKAQELGLTKLIMVRGTDNSKREPKETRFLERAPSSLTCNDLHQSSLADFVSQSFVSCEKKEKFTQKA